MRGTVLAVELIYKAQLVATLHIEVGLEETEVGGLRRTLHFHAGTGIPRIVEGETAGDGIGGNIAGMVSYPPAPCGQIVLRRKAVPLVAEGHFTLIAEDLAVSERETSDERQFLQRGTGRHQGCDAMELLHGSRRGLLHSTCYKGGSGCRIAVTAGEHFLLLLQIALLHGLVRRTEFRGILINHIRGMVTPEDDGNVSVFDTRPVATGEPVALDIETGIEVVRTTLAETFGRLDGGVDGT